MKICLFLLVLLLVSFGARANQFPQDPPLVLIPPYMTEAQLIQVAFNAALSGGTPRQLVTLCVMVKGNIYANTSPSFVSVCPPILAAMAADKVANGQKP